MEKVLLLNATYEPLNVCTWQRALKLIVKGKAEEVEHNGCLINQTISAPTVIRLRYYVVVPYKELPFNKKNIYHRDEHTCQYCGKKTSDLTIDHVIPRSRGGKNTWENVAAACSKCNNKKANKTPQETGMKLSKKPCRPTNYLDFELTKYSAEAFSHWEKYTAS